MRLELMNTSLQASPRSVTWNEDEALRGPRWPGFARTVSTWPFPVIFVLLLGLVAAVGWVDYAGKLFEPFFTTKPPDQGSGLGLAIARRIMNIHGGSIRLSNLREGGARATIQFKSQSMEKL